MADTEVPVMRAVGPDGENVDLSVLEETGVAYDPSSQHLDLSHAEKRRTTALLLAIQGYKELIIKDAEYLKEVQAQARRENGPVIKPATMNAMVEAAIQFDAFIAGRYSQTEDHPVGGGSQTEAPASRNPHDNPA